MASAPWPTNWFRWRSILCTQTSQWRSASRRLGPSKARENKRQKDLKLMHFYPDGREERKVWRREGWCDFLFFSIYLFEISAWQFLLDFTRDASCHLVTVSDVKNLWKRSRNVSSWQKVVVKLKSRSMNYHLQTGEHPETYWQEHQTWLLWNTLPCSGNAHTTTQSQNKLLFATMLDDMNRMQLPVGKWMKLPNICSDVLQVTDYRRNMNIQWFRWFLLSPRHHFVLTQNCFMLTFPSGSFQSESPNSNLLLYVYECLTCLHLQQKTHENRAAMNNSGGGGTNFFSLLLYISELQNRTGIL